MSSGNGKVVFGAVSPGDHFVIGDMVLTCWRLGDQSPPLQGEMVDPH
jgi:hypothetical protein